MRLKIYLRLNRFAADAASALSGVLSLVYCGVNRPQTLKALLELGREAVVCFYLGCEECVTSAVGWLVENPEEGRARRLLFVRLNKVYYQNSLVKKLIVDTHNVGMPADFACAVSTTVLSEAVMASITIDCIELNSRM